MILFSFTLQAIEEIEISDKAVAAAVNECNTNVSVFHENLIVETNAIHMYSYRLNTVIILFFCRKLSPMRTTKTT